MQETADPDYHIYDRARPLLAAIRPGVYTDQWRKSILQHPEWPGRIYFLRLQSESETDGTIRQRANSIMDLLKITTFGELKEARYRTRGIKDEIRANLIHKLKNRETAFEGIIGFENTVIPDLETAILSRHNLLLLGLRG